jgi:hypothetical protein
VARIVFLRGRLYIAWKGSGNDNINIMFSEDNGMTFKDKRVSLESSTNSPCLIPDIVENGSIAWKG